METVIKVEVFQSAVAHELFSDTNAIVVLLDEVTSFQSAVAHELFSDHRSPGVAVGGVGRGFKALSRMSSSPTRVRPQNVRVTQTVSKRCRA